MKYLEKLAVTYWFFLMTFSAPVYLLLMLYILFFTRFAWIVFLYSIWLFIDRNTMEQGGRKIKWIYNSRIWKHLKDYFPVTLKCSEGVVLDPKKNYLFCNFPHGVLSVGTFAALGTSSCGIDKLFPSHNIFILTLNMNFYIPIRRELIMAQGRCSVSAKSMKYILNNENGGNIAVLTPGGAKEAYLSEPGKYIIYYESRKGFIKLALQSGTDLVPIITFGETDLYFQYKFSGWFKRFQAKIESIFGFAFIIVKRFLPRRKPLVTISRPLEINLKKSPTIADIDKVHTDFKQQLVQLFEEHKHKYVENFENVHLQFV